MCCVYDLSTHPQGEAEGERLELVLGIRQDDKAELNDRGFHQLETKQGKVLAIPIYQPHSETLASNINTQCKASLPS